MTTYRDALTAAMETLSLNPRAVFLGQSIRDGGTAMTTTFAGVPRDRLIELPVFENTQLGMATGMALAGDLPVCVFPRINFLLCAIDQLVLHINALPRYSAYRPKVIIRTAIATPEPLDPGPQHLGNYCIALGELLNVSRDWSSFSNEIRVVKLNNVKDIEMGYRWAMERELSTILVERTELYDTEG